jgi:hypothetical protein
MRFPTKAALAAGFSLAAAAPCLAVTVTQPPLGVDSQADHRSDPDAAIGNTAAYVRQSVVENGLRAQGAGAFTGSGSAAPYGYSSQTSQFGPVVTQTETDNGGLGLYGAQPSYGPPLVLPVPGHRP